MVSLGPLCPIPSLPQDCAVLSAAYVPMWAETFHFPHKTDSETLLLEPAGARAEPKEEPSSPPSVFCVFLFFCGGGWEVGHN